MRINDINIKRGFTLFELIVVVILLSIVSGFVLIKFDVLSTKNTPVSFENLKSHLLEFKFNKKLSLKCTEQTDCLLFIDGILQEEKINLSISNSIEVYKYDNTLTQIFFKDLELENLERHSIIFDITIDKDKKHKDFIVLNNDKVYIFNSIYKTPIVKSSLSDINDYFENLKDEVKNSAF